MSDNKKYIETYSVEENSSINEDLEGSSEFLMSVFSYAVKNAISDMESYWTSNDAQKILKEDTFNYIWNSFPDQRNNLLKLAINQAGGGGYSNRISSLTKPFCREFIENFYASVPVDDKKDTNSLRIRLAPILDKDFNYLAELNKFSLIEEDEEVYSMWERVALSCSKDENLFDYLWSKVKREKGATDKKDAIIKAAQNRGALSNSLVARIAKSSPKRLKRTVVSGINEDMSNLNRKLRSAENYPESSTPEEIAEIKEKLANLESRAMLYVGCTDYTVVESLIDCLSRDNLPWLMPSVSEHYWLGQRLSRLIESEDT